MKCIFLLLFISFSTAASNWMPVSKIQESSSQAYQLEGDCKKSGEECFDIGDEPEIVSKGFALLQDDWGPEIDIESCSDEADCTAKLATKECSENFQKFISIEYSRVYCVELLGKKLVKDNAGFSGYKAGLAQKQVLESAIGMAVSLRACGERVMALMLVRNQPKGLSTTQVKQLVSTYASIKSLLESGSLVSAKEEITAVAADGVLVTVADKTALNLEIDKCLGL